MSEKYETARDLGVIQCAKIISGLISDIHFFSNMTKAKIFTCVKRGTVATPRFDNSWNASFLGIIKAQQCIAANSPFWLQFENFEHWKWILSFAKSNIHACRKCSTLTTQSITDAATSESRNTANNALQWWRYLKRYLNAVQAHWSAFILSSRGTIWLLRAWDLWVLRKWRAA